MVRAVKLSRRLVHSRCILRLKLGQTNLKYRKRDTENRRQLLRPSGRFSLAPFNFIRTQCAPPRHLDIYVHVTRLHTRVYVRANV